MSGKRGADGVDEAVQVLAPVGVALAVSPHRARPVGIVLVAGNDVVVQLRDDIAKRADIDLAAGGDALQRLAHRIRLEDQHRLVERGEIMELRDAGPLGDKDQPRPAAVIHQPQFAKAEPQHGHSVALQARVEFESGLPGTYHDVSSPCFSSEARWPQRGLQANREWWADRPLHSAGELPIWTVGGWWW